MSQSLDTALMDKLVADQTAGSFYSDLSGRIYDTEAVQNQTFPYCVVTKVSNAVDGFYGTPNGKEPLYDITLFGSKASGKVALAAINAKLFALLNKTALTATGHDRLVLTCIDEGQPSIEEDAIVILSQWRGKATAF